MYYIFGIVYGRDPVLSQAAALSSSVSSSVSVSESEEEGCGAEGPARKFREPSTFSLPFSKRFGSMQARRRRRSLIFPFIFSFPTFLGAHSLFSVETTCSVFAVYWKHDTFLSSDIPLAESR